ncbi:hypothetical protein EF910_30605 [Streptomyces sp. WAC07149]|uniref:hypothetical protein n=1 Tax=Streptomyces sp. WAC07149 TaxID=2487425 RepID=UPI000F78C3EC|nr:hypothetical protein [Streptomyces sp. WAC07149]RST00728.1 hypothetical protein EF910_30605 [Streptomyces sp. WAC07149]
MTAHRRRARSSGHRLAVLVGLLLLARASAAAGIARDPSTAEAGRREHPTPAGVPAELLPLRPGTSAAEVVRGGRSTVRVELPYAVDDRVPVQDLQYQAATSGRPR